MQRHDVASTLRRRCINRPINHHTKISWLEKVNHAESLDANVSITLSAHHSSYRRGHAFEVSIASFLRLLLSLLRESTHSVATIRHVTDKYKDSVTHLNPDHTTFIATDQPLYVLAEQIEW